MQENEDGEEANCAASRDSCAYSQQAYKLLRLTAPTSPCSRHFAQAVVASRKTIGQTNPGGKCFSTTNFKRIFFFHQLDINFNAPSWHSTADFCEKGKIHRNHKGFRRLALPARPRPQFSHQAQMAPTVELTKDRRSALSVLITPIHHTTRLQGRRAPVDTTTS